MSASKITDFRPRRPIDADQRAARIERMTAFLDTTTDPEIRRLLADARPEAMSEISSEDLARLSNFAGQPDNAVLAAEAEWDRATAEHEDLFRRRFGFSWQAAYREELLRLKRRLKMSDAEITQQFRVGNLRRRESRVRFAASLAGAILGWTMIGMLLLPMGFLALGIATHPHLTVPQLTQVAMLATVLLAIKAGVYRLQIEPWQILRRAA